MCYEFIVPMLIFTFIFKGRDDVYESTWFAYKNLAFIADRSTPRPSLRTVIILYFILF